MDESRRQGLRLSAAALWLLAAAVLAQMAGAVCADLLRAMLRVQGATPAQLERSPFVIIPAMLASTSTLLTVTLFAPRVHGSDVRSAFGLRPAPPFAFASAALGTVMLGPSADWLMSVVAERFPDATLGVVPMLNDIVEHASLWIVWPAFALMPGISEELAFRGLLQNALRPGLRAIAVSGIAFALFHVDPHHVAGVLPLGLFLAWVGARAGTYVTAFAHVVNNSVAILAVRTEALDVGYGTDQPMPASWLPASLVLAAASAWLLVRVTPGRARAAH